MLDNFGKRQSGAEADSAQHIYDYFCVKQQMVT